MAVQDVLLGEVTGDFRNGGVGRTKNIVGGGVNREEVGTNQPNRHSYYTYDFRYGNGLSIDNTIRVSNERQNENQAKILRYGERDDALVSVSDVEKDLIYGKQSIVRNVPHLTAYEIQPNTRYNFLEEAVNVLSEVVGGGYDSTRNKTGSPIISGINAAVELFKKGGQVGAKAVGLVDKIASTKSQNVLLNNIASSGKALFTDMLLDKPVNYYKGFVTGAEVGKVVVPYNDNAYLKTDGGNWTQGMQTSDLSEQFGSLKKFASLAGHATSIGDESKGTSLFGSESNLPTSPKWGHDSGGGIVPSTTFQLYNTTLDALVANFKFISTLYSGSSWANVGYTQKSSNLYDVEIAGRGRYFFCALDINVEYQGKSRVLHPLGVKHMQSKGVSQFDNNWVIPDSYRVTMSFRPLVPQNLNMFLNYLMNKGNNESDHEDISKIGSTPLDAVVKSVSSTGNDIVKAFK